MLSKDFKSTYDIFEPKDKVFEIFPSEPTDEDLKYEYEFLMSETLPCDFQGIDDSFIEFEEKQMADLLKHEPK